MAPPRSRLETALAVAVFIIVGVGAAASVRWWQAVGAGAVLLLFITDRGQHRRMADLHTTLPRWYVAALSVGASLLHNLLALGLTYLGIWIWLRLFV